MNRSPRIVAVSGGLQHPSKTLALAGTLAERLAAAGGADAQVLSLADLGPHLGAALWRDGLAVPVQRALAAIESADLLIVASPVFRGSYAGLFKHLFDLVDQHALVDKPVLLAATGGSERHALVIDHQLRPLFAFFQAHTLPVGVYATDRDFRDHRVADAALDARIDLAVARALPALRRAAESGAAADAAPASAAAPVVPLGPAVVPVALAA